MACSTCKGHLQVEDGHDLCPTCLGIGHLREALTDQACMNCRILPLSVREARLREVENLLYRGDLPPSGVPSGGKEKRKRESHSKRRQPARKKPAATDTAPYRHEMDDLRAEIERLKAMVQPLPHLPPAPLLPQAA